MKTGTLKLKLPKLLDRVQPSSTAVLIGTAIVVGAGTGLGAVFFIKLIDWIQRLFFEGGEAGLSFLGRGLFILIPIAGGLLSGPIIAFFAKEAKGHGVPEVMQAIALRGGRIRPRVVVAKIAASAMCIGSGGSAGREGPIVQVGAALGSTLGQWLNLSEMRIRNLVACGSAAGIAATFNAPIAGVVFAMEIILGELHLGDLGNVVISAVTASVMARLFLGERPAFSIPRYGVKTPWEILLYPLLGILSAFAAVFFIRLLYRFEDVFDHWHFPDALKPAVGGLLLGGVAFFYPIVLGMGFVPVDEARLGFPLSANMPHIFSAGFPVIEGALLGQLSFVLLFLLIFLKPLATSFTLGSGNSGGVFAPALFTGAALGGAFGRLVEVLAPGATAGPGAFATVGMAAVFAGAARAPFTAILIVFEMTNDYGLILPLMAGVIFSMLVAERLHRESIYTLKLARRGIRLQSGQDVDVMEAVRVDEVMVRQPATVPTDMPVSLLAGEFLRTGRHGFPVLNSDGSLHGIVSLADYRRSVANGDELPEKLTVKDISTQDVVVAYPDETVGVVLRRMAPRDLSRVPVVARDNPRRLVGVIRRNDIVRAHEIGALRRDEARRRAETLKSVKDSSAQFVDVLLVPGSHSVGKTIATLHLPREAVLVSIRRGQDLVIPHGDTVLQVGDVVTALCERACAGNVLEELNRLKSEEPNVSKEPEEPKGPKILNVHEDSEAPLE
ncbi:MAG TPA: chloride channel protein [Anaerolineales bacterium]|jgi:CIC family chloride channel protein|nr:chloride channel protein [Anaerolineales bacterium]